MAEYIDREALLDSLRESETGLREIAKGLRFPIEKQICDAQIITFVECILRVKSVPTADVVEVVKAAEILNDAFGNDVPCNFNNIDEWLPYVCEYANTCDCSSVKCWEQLIKHYGERRCEE